MSYARSHRNLHQGGVFKLLQISRIFLNIICMKIVEYPRTIVCMNMVEQSRTIMCLNMVKQSRTIM